jgi:hypothetical protein
MKPARPGVSENPRLRADERDRVAPVRVRVTLQRRTGLERIRGTRRQAREHGRRSDLSNQLLRPVRRRRAIH